MPNRESNNMPVALVTGSAQGIGLGIADELLGCGYAVTLADINEDGQPSVAWLRERHPEAALLYVRTDVSDPASVEAAVAQTLDTFGRLDGLVNNAGLPKARFDPLEQLDLESWHRVIAVNLTGTMLMCRAAIPALKEAHGVIVNIASTRAFQSEAHGEAYAASKGGVLSLTHALAVSLSHTVRVNAICPGWIDVRSMRPHSSHEPKPYPESCHVQHPAGRIGTPHDIAKLARFLLSQDASFITGQQFVADGGMSKRMMYPEDDPRGR